MNQWLPHPETPIQLGHYQVLSPLGRGGMGVVYLAHDTRLERQVAIKCLHSELFEAHYIERFKREALLLAKLNHPNIVQIYDFIETPEQLALVMELVEGQNLQLHLREHIASFAQRMRWLSEIAQGLAVAHDAGIIHRDLKAENILINQRKVAKITDLGIAKSQDFNATLTDHVAGSYCSMSPEQAMGEALDFKSDLFSFGILAYQLLCGAHPFGDTHNKLQLMQRIISHPPIAPGKHNPNLPAEINDLLGQLLSKDPDKRPDNTHWVAAQLESLSHLQLANDFVSDDTQALPLGKPAVNPTPGQTSYAQERFRTGDHPTFDTRFINSRHQAKITTIEKLKQYWQASPIGISLGALTLVIISAAGLWQLQPKPPKFIAVLPPKLDTKDMPESQQELIKAAVYDAIQQSLLQLDNYYLIPQEHILEVNADSTKEGIETLRRATSANELITSSIHCKLDACSITLSRLTPQDTQPNSRLRLSETKRVDVLTDNYLSVATIVQSNVGALYLKDIQTPLASIDKDDYEKLLIVSQQYRDKGASKELLKQLEQLARNTKQLPATQTLYSEITLDLHYETNDKNVLDSLAEFIEGNRQESATLINSLNHFYLQVAQKKYADAEQTIATIKSFNPSASIINELFGYSSLSQKDYESAVRYYQKALSIKATTNNYYYLSLAYWYQSNFKLAKVNLELSLKLSPKLYKSHNLLGLISLIEGDTDTAKKSFKQLLELQPNSTTSLNNLGLCYLLEGNHTQASQLFLRAEAMAPTDSAYLLNIADTYDLALKQQESNQAYQKLIVLLANQKPNSSNQMHLAQAYAHLGNYSKALEHLQQLEQINPQSYQTLYTAALVHTLAKNKASALLKIEKSLHAGVGSAWFKLAWFDPLCADEKFLQLMKSAGAANRCAPR